jgi:ubiquinone/menaquinone biosynthesis C-methylase UbiE
MTRVSYRDLAARHPDLKDQVQRHWDQEPCESRAGKTALNRRKFFEEIDAYRDSTSPFIAKFARFEAARGQRVLEIGLGSGSDFMRWARAGAELSGVDLTAASVALCRERLELEGLAADVRVGDAEQLEFPDATFDLVYSYGVIHHSPNTERIVEEIRRVLKPGGTVRVMIYNARGLSIAYQWLLHAVLKKFQPWKSPREIVYYHNESLGTKLYSRREAQTLFSSFAACHVRTVVDSGDTLNFQLSARYRDDAVIRAAFKMFWFLKHARPLIPGRLGTTMLIEATKPLA